MNTNRSLSLEQCLTPTIHPDDSLLFTVPDNWLQGRSCFGGLSASIGLTAIRKQMPQDRPLRSLQVVFAGPVAPGEAKATVSSIRDGKSVSVLEAKVSTQGSIGTMVTGIFGEARETIGIESNVKTSLPKISESVIDEKHARGLPNFISNIDVRWLGDGIPFSGQKSKTMKMWVRLKQPQNISNEVRILTLSDTPPPIMASHFSRPIKMSSLTWSLETICDLNDQHGEWMFVDARLESAGSGYCVQTTEFYNEAGQLLMFGRQNMTYFS